MVRIPGRGKKDKEEGEEQPVETASQLVPARKRVTKPKKAKDDNGRGKDNPFEGVAVVEDEASLDDQFQEPTESRQVIMSDDAQKNLQGILLSPASDDLLLERSIIENAAFVPTILAHTMSQSWSKASRRDSVTGKVKPLMQVYLENMMRGSRSREGRWIKTGLELGRTKSEEGAQGDVWQQ